VPDCCILPLLNPFTDPPAARPHCCLPPTCPAPAHITTPPSPPPTHPAHARHLRYRAAGIAFTFSTGAVDLDVPLLLHLQNRYRLCYPLYATTLLPVTLATFEQPDNAVRHWWVPGFLVGSVQASRRPTAPPPTPTPPTAITTCPVGVCATQFPCRLRPTPPAPAFASPPHVPATSLRTDPTLLANWFPAPVSPGGGRYS